jgi:O-antigen ligase
MMKNVALILIFLLPLLATVLRHWVSTIFILLSITSVILLRKEHLVGLPSQERLLYFLFTMFFAAFIASSIIAGWDQGSNRLLEREARFLFLLPLVVLMSSIPNIKRYFTIGAVLSVFIACPIVLYQSHVLDLGNDLGTYGPLFTGPVIVLFVAIAYPYMSEIGINRSFSTLVKVTVLFMTIIIAFYTSRSAILGFFIFLLLFYGLKDLRKGTALVILATVLIAIIVSMNPNSLQARKLELTLTETKNYLLHEVRRENEVNPYGDRSTGKRLELLKGSFYIFTDNPIWGIGGYNFQHQIGVYAERYNLHPSLANSNHPHNFIAEVAVSKGLFGLVPLTICFFLLLRSGNRGLLNRGGKIAIFVLIVMMMTEAAIITKSNFVSIFVFSMALLISIAKRTNYDGSVRQN